MSDIQWSDPAQFIKTCEESFLRCGSDDPDWLLIEELLERYRRSTSGAVRRWVDDEGVLHEAPPPIPSCPVLVIFEAQE